MGHTKTKKKFDKKLTMTDSRSIAPLISSFVAGMGTVFLVNKLLERGNKKNRTNGEEINSICNCL
jgi:hypothetical protein